MCRIVLYVGMSKPILLADLLIRPEHSIIRQSFDAQERSVTEVLPPAINADGFGVSWYAENYEQKRDGPCLFTSVTPAWNNRNLYRLCSKISSPLVFAHVRAASHGSIVSEQNCHPFVVGPFTFMHNGGIGNFLDMKQHYIQFLRPDLYKLLLGSTDSEHAFLLFLNFLPKRAIIGTSPSSSNIEPNALYSSHSHEHVTYSFESPKTLFSAFKDMILQMIRFQVETQTKTISLLNFAVSDGRTTLVSRIVVNTKYLLSDQKSSSSSYASPSVRTRQKRVDSYTSGPSNKTVIPPSLYFSVGSGFIKAQLETALAEQAALDRDIGDVPETGLISGISTVSERNISPPMPNILMARSVDNMRASLGKFGKYGKYSKVSKLDDENDQDVTSRGARDDPDAPDFASMRAASVGQHENLLKRGKTLYRMVRDETDTRDVVVVASERLTSLKEDWVEVPSNHILVISNKSKVTLYSVKVEKAIRRYRKEWERQQKLEKERLEHEEMLKNFERMKMMSKHKDAMHGSVVKEPGVECKRHVQSKELFNVRDFLKPIYYCDRV